MRPLPQPPRIWSGEIPCTTAGLKGVEGGSGAVIAGRTMGGFRIGAPAANTQAGADSTVVIVVTAKESRRHIEVLPRRDLPHYSRDDCSVQRVIAAATWAAQLTPHC